MTMSEQMERKLQNDSKPKRTKIKNVDKTISTGSTLLDLAIAGGRNRIGGMPGGIMVEIFGPSSSGKSVLLCEIAGDVVRKGGQVMFRDPEARLNKDFAKMFDLDVKSIDYAIPQTVPEVFAPVREWEPKGGSGTINGIFADSLAALSTDMELEGKDQYGMRRAKEFSEELRKTCRILSEKNFLMVCSNQIRQNLDAGPYGQKMISPGGKAIEFYSSLRLRMVSSEKIKSVSKFKGKEISKIVGVKTFIEVCKSSVWEPYHTAPITILFDYGIDDIRSNLQYIKTYSGQSVYTVGDSKLDKSMEEAIAIIESEKLEATLKEEVIDLWNEIELKMKTSRKSKH
jgi:recombination protein RecA